MKHEELIADVHRVEGHLKAVRRALEDHRLFAAFEAAEEAKEHLEALGFRMLTAKSAEMPIDDLTRDIELQDLIADFCDGEQGTEDVG